MMGFLRMILRFILVPKTLARLSRKLTRISKALTIVVVAAICLGDNGISAMVQSVVELQRLLWLYNLILDGSLCLDCRECRSVCL